jgi:hypothetical protein
LLDDGVDVHDLSDEHLHPQLFLYLLFGVEGLALEVETALHDV